MKKLAVGKVLLLALIAIAAVVPSSAAPILCATTTCTILPTATYLTAAGPFNGTSFSQDGTDPVYIDLQALGLTTGNVITLTASGSINYTTGTTNLTASPNLGGVFSSSTSYQSNSLTANRVTNALAAPSGTTAATSSTYVGGTSVTLYGNIQTDITQDFLIFQGAGTTFTLPNIATYRYLFVGLVDNYYADNTGGPLTLRITSPALVPEPATYALFLSGLGALVAFRRYRKN
jgi:hypothetical protein